MNEQNCTITKTKMVVKIWPSAPLQVMIGISLILISIGLMIYLIKG